MVGPVEGLRRAVRFALVMGVPRRVERGLNGLDGVHALVSIEQPVDEAVGLVAEPDGLQVGPDARGHRRKIINRLDRTCWRERLAQEHGGAALDTFVKKARYGAGLVSRNGISTPLVA